VLQSVYKNLDATKDDIMISGSVKYHLFSDMNDIIVGMVQQDTIARPPPEGVPVIHIDTTGGGRRRRGAKR
jgi:hypothetical protein